MKRCHWVTQDKTYIDYHDKEWGMPVYDSPKLFEFILLEGAQAGLNWITILKKREGYRKLFDDFNPEKIAKYNQTKINNLLNNSGIIRNKLKIASAITNAQAYLNIPDFAEFIWDFVDGQPIQNHYTNPKDIPTSTPLSDKLSKELRARGFKFVGTTICYAFMQAVGLTNDHLTTCFRHPVNCDIL